MQILSSFLIIMKISVALILFFNLLPRLLLPMGKQVNPSDRLWFVSLLTLCWSTTAVYLLVFLKLYSVVSLFILMAFGYIAYLKYLRHEKPLNYVTDKLVVLGMIFFDYLDGIIKPQVYLKRFYKKAGYLGKKAVKRLTTPYIMVFFVIMGISVYLRFLIPVTTFAPSMSDSYVGMAWMKYLGQNRIFVDGIYPQGFYIFLSMIGKFSGEDALYILRFTGPLVNTFMVFSLYWFTKKWARSVWAGLLTAFIYGTFTTWELPREFIRQMASLSQEYSLLFLLPGLYFLLTYVKSKRHNYLIAYSFTLCLILLTHPIGSLGILLGVLAVMASGFVFHHWDKKSFQRFIIYSIAATVTGVLPLVIGKLMGLDFHGSSAEYAFAVTGAAEFTPLLIAMIVFSIILIITNYFLRDENVRMNSTFVFLWFYLSMLAYFSRNLGFKWMFDPARVAVLVVISGVIITGLALNNIIYLTKRIIFVSKFRESSLLITMIVILIFASLYPPEKKVPYKMEYDIFPKTYLEISENYPPLEWTIVSQVEEYPLVLNRGWHLMLTQFVDRYKPDKMKYPTPYIFVFVEKEIFKISINRTEADYEQRRKEEKALSEWVEKYRQGHNDISIYYDDPKVRIYKIDAREEFNRQLEEDSKSSTKSSKVRGN